MTDKFRSDDSSDNAKLKSAGILGKYYSLFDGAFDNVPRRSSDDLLQELEQLLESAVLATSACLVEPNAYSSHFMIENLINR